MTVEVSRYALEFRARRGDALRAALDRFRSEDRTLPPGLQAVEAQLAMPFEHRAAAAYGASRGARVAAIGDSEVSRERLGLFEREVLDPGNLARLAASPQPSLAEAVQRERRRAEQQWRQGPPLGSEEQARIAATDRRVAAELRGRLGDGGLVHVGGWEHLSGLGARLGDLGVEVRLI